MWTVKGWAVPLSSVVCWGNDLKALDEGGHQEAPSTCLCQPGQDAGGAGRRHTERAGGRSEGQCTGVSRCRSSICKLRPEVQRRQVLPGKLGAVRGSV